jgi:hypothetical protein
LKKRTHLGAAPAVSGDLQFEAILPQAQASRGVLQFEANSGSRGDSKKRTHFAGCVDLQNEANA